MRFRSRPHLLVFRPKLHLTMRYFFRFAIIVLGMALASGCGGPETTRQETDQGGQAPDPLQSLSEKIHKDSLDADLYHKRARLYLEKGMVNEALGDLGDAIGLAPDRPEFYISLGDAYLAMGNMPGCLEALQKAEKLDPVNNEALLKLAEVSLILTDYPGTFRYVEKALRVDTKNPRAYFIRGYALMETGDTAAAIRSIQNAFDQDPQYYEAAVQLGILYATRQNPLAAQYFQAAIRIDPNRDAAYYLLGTFWQETGMVEQAVETYHRLIVINPSFKEAYYNLGYIYLVMKEDFSGAVDFFTQAIQQDPRYVDAYYNRAYSHELSGNYPQARKDYAKTLELRPNHEMAVEGMNRLDRLQ